MKFAFVNGQLVPSAKASVSIFDRGFAYGDGLFETLRVTGGQPRLWDEHWERFRRGADRLRIHLAYDSAGLRKHVDKLLEKNESPNAMLRIHLSRGMGPRGYSPREANSPLLVMSTHPLPPAPKAWKLATTAFRLPPVNVLSAIKTSNKLLHVLAKAEAESHGADEALLLTDSGALAQGASSNLFWIERQTVFTTPEQTGILPGVTRAAALRACERLKIPVRQTTAPPEKLRDCAGVFMTLSTWCVVETSSLDDHALDRSPIAAQIRNLLLPQ